MMNLASDKKMRLARDVKMTPIDWLVDCVVAAGVFGLGLMQIALFANIFVPDDFIRRILGIHVVTPSAIAILGTFLISVPLIVRRKYPWPTLIASIVIWLVFEFIDLNTSYPIYALLVAQFSVCCECNRNQALASSLITLLIAIIPVIDTEGSGLAALLVFQNVACVIAVGFAGYALNTRQQVIDAAEVRVAQAEQLRESEKKRAEAAERLRAAQTARALEAERTRESEASKRVEEERVRIARELHDITAHSLSAVSIQAAVAERLIDTDPNAAKDAIADVRSTAKEALGDMRSMVGILRSGSDTLFEPTNGTDKLADLVGYLEDAGVKCELVVEGYNAALVPRVIDVALYGIAREACTNIVRHASAKSATITLRVDGGQAILEICDDGKGFPGDASQNSGHGIEGMRERVKLLDGAFDASSITEGGVCIKAKIPLMQEVR